MEPALGSVWTLTRHVPVMAEEASAILCARPPRPWSVSATRECSTPSGREMMSVTGMGAAAPDRVRTNVVRCTASPAR